MTSKRMILLRKRQNVSEVERINERRWGEFGYKSREEREKEGPQRQKKRKNSKSYETFVQSSEVRDVTESYKRRRG
jgi:hypothetical protein